MDEGKTEVSRINERKAVEERGRQMKREEKWGRQSK